MPARVLAARREGAWVRVRVHLDAVRVQPQEDGPPVPDPAWVVEWTWPATPPQGMTAATWGEAIRREVRAYVAEELARRDSSAAAPLAWEGAEP